MSNFKSVQEGVKAESQKVISELQTLRDEIKLKLHLASAEGRDAWNKLEPQIEQFERKVGDAAESAVEDLKTAGGELKANLEAIYQSLRIP